MKISLQKFDIFLSSVRNNFFLRKHIISAPTLKLLQDIYPTVNWQRVDFYEGLPWFTPMVAPYVTAQALPDFYSFGKFRIYIKKFDESRDQCLSDIVHEGFHIVQYLQFGNGYGLGFLRGLMVYYNALFLKHGYRQNPFEVPAYDQEHRFLEYCRKNGFHVIQADKAYLAFAELHKNPEMVFTTFDFKYTGGFFPLLGSFFICLLIALVKPLADFLVFIVRLFIRSRHGKEKITL